MQRQTSIHCYGAEKFLRKLRIELTAHRRGKVRVKDEIRSAGNVQRTEGERFIHGHVCAADPADAAPVAERIVDCPSEADANVLDCVVRVNVQIAPTAKG